MPPPLFCATSIKRSGHSQMIGRKRTNKQDDDQSETAVVTSPARSIMRQESRRWSTADRTTDNLRGHLKRRISLSTKLFSTHLGEDRDPKSPTGLFGKKVTRERRGNRPEESEQRVRMLMSAEMYDRITRAQKQERDHDSMVNQFKLRTTPTGLQGDSMWINFALSSPQGLGMLAPRKRWSPNGWSHAARVALLLTTLGQERDLLTQYQNQNMAHIVARLREQQILDFMKTTCSILVLTIADYYQIAAELAELRSLLENFLQRSNANFEMHSQHEILFPFNSLESLKVQLKKLQAAEVSDGWHACVKKCVAQNLRTMNSSNDRSLDAMVDQQQFVQPFQPEGPGMLAWEMFILILLYCQFLMVPFLLSYPMQRREVFFDLIAETFLFLDILVHFNLAYFAAPRDSTERFSTDFMPDGTTRPSIKKTPILVLDRRLIALHYVSGHSFYLDIISASPIIISISAIFDGKSVYKYASVKLLKYVRMFDKERMTSVTRKVPGLVFQQHARQSSRYTSLLKLASLLSIIAITMHVLACVWHLITPQHHWELRYNQHNDTAAFLSYSKLQRRKLYLMSYYESILILMGEQINMSQIKEYVFAIISTVLFSFLLAIIFGEVAMFIANFNELPFAYSQKMSELHESMSTKSLPRVLQDRVYAFYDFLWREHKTLNGRLKVAELLPELTSNLAIEVRLFWCKDMLLNVPFFQLFPPPIVQQLVVTVDINFYMPDDYIVVAGGIGHEMFFLKKGKVDIFRVDETEIEISDDFAVPKPASGVNGHAVIEEQRRNPGRSFINSAKSTTRSISTGVKNAALQGVSTVKQAMPARKRGASALEVEPPIHTPPERQFKCYTASEMRCLPTELQMNVTAARLSVEKSVRVRRMQREQILRTLKPGEFFGEIALISQCPRTATVKARSFIECAIILRKNIENMLLDYPHKHAKTLAIIKARYKAGEKLQLDQHRSDAAIASYSDHKRAKASVLKLNMSNSNSTTMGSGIICGVGGCSKVHIAVCKQLAQVEASTQGLGGRVIRLIDAKLSRKASQIAQSGGRPAHVFAQCDSTS